MSKLNPVNHFGLLAAFLFLSACGRWETRPFQNLPTDVPAAEREKSELDRPDVNPPLEPKPGPSVLDEQPKDEKKSEDRVETSPDELLTKDEEAKRGSDEPEVTLTKEELDVVVDWTKSEVPEPTPDMSEAQKLEIAEAKKRETENRERAIAAARAERLAKEKAEQDRKALEREQAIQDEMRMRDEAARNKARETRLAKEAEELKEKQKLEEIEKQRKAQREQALRDEQRLRDEVARKAAEKKRLEQEKAEKEQEQAADIKRAQEIEADRIREQRLADKKKKLAEEKALKAKQEAEKVAKQKQEAEKTTKQKEEAEKTAKQKQDKSPKDQTSGGQSSSSQNNKNSEQQEFDPNEKLPFAAPQGTRVIERGELIPTVYYFPVFNQDKNGCESGDKRKMLGSSGEVLIETCVKIEKACRLQGTCGIVQNGKYRGFNAGITVGGSLRYFEITKNGCEFGYGVKRLCLDPFYTLAADMSLYKAGQVVYIPLVKGTVLPDGSKHTGYFIIRDMGYAILGKGRFDFYSGYSAWFNGANPFTKLGLADKRMSRLYEARYGRKVEYFLVDGAQAEKIRMARAYPKYPSHQSVSQNVSQR